MLLRRNLFKIDIDGGSCVRKEKTPKSQPEYQDPTASALVMVGGFVDQGCLHEEQTLFRGHRLIHLHP